VNSGNRRLNKDGWRRLFARNAGYDFEMAARRRQGNGTAVARRVVSQLLKEYLAGVDDPQPCTIAEYDRDGSTGDNDEVALPHGASGPKLLDGAIPTNYAHLTRSFFNKTIAWRQSARKCVIHGSAWLRDRTRRCERQLVVGDG
jgi:hypothetical protein